MSSSDSSIPYGWKVVPFDPKVVLFVDQEIMLMDGSKGVICWRKTFDPPVFVVNINGYKHDLHVSNLLVPSSTKFKECYPQHWLSLVINNVVYQKDITCLHIGRVIKVNSITEDQPTESYDVKLETGDLLKECLLDRDIQAFDIKKNSEDSKLMRLVPFFKCHKN